MSKSLKRKNEVDDEFVEDIINLRKRAKLEDIIFRAVSEREKSQDHFSESKIAEKCDKVVTSIRLKKKYKYHCKKHNMSYLVDSVRKEKKQISKQNRNNLVQSFRSLAVSAADSFDAPVEEDGLDKNGNHLMLDQINDVKSDDVKDVFKRPEMPISKAQKRKASDSPLEVNKNRSEAINPFKRLAVKSVTEEAASNEYQNSSIGQVGTSTPKVSSPNKHKNSGGINDLPTPKLSLSSLPKLLDGTFTLSDDESEVFDYFKSSERSHPRKKILLPCKINFDEEEDSDCERNQQDGFKNYKVIKSFVVTKNPEKGGIVFKKGPNYYETDTDCDCSVYDSLLDESSNCEYWSSSSGDETDIGILTG
ncbi:hypothetical protein TSAR_003765 [Trichomalopsis sarcophagae]|uniref:Uncharacterized protein n=1 Tax=Trichomalopsis sarcophagae TaxID=543379 RepID=A0A232ELV2_9HYME|nr:hypothetical protein TSAR_003765 [Trichomalopsis sarcophagae]